MLTEFTLVNVPKEGVDHLVDGRRYSINDTLTNQDAKKLIEYGLGKYFKPVKTSETNGQPKNPSAGNTNAGSTK